MTEDWNFYQCEVDGDPAFINVDLGQADDAPRADMPNLLLVRMAVESADGLPDREEFRRLDEIEDKLLPALLEETGAVHVGTMTTVGRRELFLYGPDVEKFGLVAGRVLSEFPDRVAEWGGEEDADWAVYQEFLLPDGRDYQQIMNRRVIESLAEAGDDSERPRPIEHTLFFPTEEARADFVRAAEGMGFTVAELGEEDLSDESDDDETEEPDAGFEPPAPLFGAAEDSDEDDEDDEPEEPLPYRVEIIREDKADMATINPLVDELYVKAQQLGGRYDGWGSPVVPRTRG